jgi:serine/threonine protein kinase
MAPECLSRDHYNLKADVYTFSIIVWELISGQTPYMFARRRHELINYVVEEKGRPDVDESWPTSIQGMLESSFDADIDKRPVSSNIDPILSCSSITPPPHICSPPS